MHCACGCIGPAMSCGGSWETCMSESEKLSRDAQRFLDDQPHGALNERDAAAAKRLKRASGALRVRLSDSDPFLTDRVMAEVRREVAPKRAATAWAFEPRAVRVRP